jgi:hypothetical protein
MTSTAALAALQQHGIIPRLLMQPCVHDYVDTQRNHLSLSRAPNHCISGFLWRHDNEDLLITLEETFPKHPGESVVVAMAINSFREQPFPAGSSLGAIALASLAPPNLTDGRHPWRTAMWCTSRCTSMRLMLQSTDSSTYLYVRRGFDGGLSLMDEQYDFALASAAQKYLAARGIDPH